MTIHLDDRTLDREDGHLPFTQQLANHFRQAIASGDLRPGDELPSEHTVMKVLGISRNVVRNAYELLDRDALTVRHPGMPTTVAPRPPVRTMDGNHYREGLGPVRAGRRPLSRSAFVSEHGARPQDYSVDPLEVATEAATEADAALLQVTAGNRIVRVRMVRNLSGNPLEIVRRAYPLEVASGTQLADAKSQPGDIETDLFLAGHDPWLAVHTIEGGPPNAEERRRLDMHTSDWVWRVVRVWHSGGRPIAADRTIMPMGRNVLRFEVDLRPPRGKRP